MSRSEIDALLDHVLGDARTDGEQLRALHRAFAEHVPLPDDAFIIGEAVSVLAIDYDGNTRLGLTARCARSDGSEHVVAANEVAFSPGSGGAQFVAVYRKWLGADPIAAAAPSGATAGRGTLRHKATLDDIDLDSPIELVVLAPRERTARCRVLGTERDLTLRSAGAWKLVAGEIVTVDPRKAWIHAKHPYLSGDVVSHRVDVFALDLAPLELRDEWPWDPNEQYWGEEGEPLEEWAREIIARGPRPSFEMERVTPGEDPMDWDSDPVIEASDLCAAGDRAGAEKILGELLTADLRCLDAHAHLGNFAFDHDPEKAGRHYEMGAHIGELSLSDDFDGLLPWGRVDNRPYLRCLHGFGLCLWRLDRHEDAAGVFTRMLWLTPSDNQGIRILLPEVRAGKTWREDDDPPEDAW